MSFSFGAASSAPPAFGATTATFGQPSMQNSTPQFGTGITANQPQGFQFGSTTQPATQPQGLFGAPNTSVSTAPPAFGTGSGAAPAFGVSNPTPSFGLPQTSTTNTGLLGAPASTGTTFGTTASAAPAATGFSFGAPSSVATTQPSAGGLSFGAPATSTALTFSAPATTAAPALSFGLTPASSASAPTVPTLGLSFGTSTSATTPAFSLNSSNANTLATSTSAPVSISFGLGGTAAATTSSLTLSTSTAPANVGLGGIATVQAKSGSAVAAQKEIPPKDQVIPNEIQQTVEQFKTVVKQQKNFSSDVARCSVREFHKVEQEIDLLNNLLTEVETQLHKNRNIAEKLKYDTAKGLQNVEMAQRTQDTPPGLQYENTAPLKFFLDLADVFEKEMMALKLQIESADKFVKNINNPDQITHQDLALGMRRLHETFVALAGRLQAVHSQVENQKESYINLRKHVFGDARNPFEKITNSSDFINSNLTRVTIHSPPKVATGPTPFNNLNLGNGVIAATMQQQNQITNQSAAAPPALGGIQFGMQTTSQPSNTSLFGNTSLQQPSFSFNNPNNNNSFQLQKPPVGNKRGKQ